MLPVVPRAAQCAGKLQATRLKLQGKARDVGGVLPLPMPCGYLRAARGSSLTERRNASKGGPERVSAANNWDSCGQSPLRERSFDREGWHMP